MIMEGNTLARQRDAAARGVRSPGGVCLEALDRLYPEIRFDVVNAAEAGEILDDRIRSAEIINRMRHCVGVHG